MRPTIACRVVFLAVYMHVLLGRTLTLAACSSSDIQVVKNFRTYPTCKLKAGFSLDNDAKIDVSKFCQTNACAKLYKRMRNKTLLSCAALVPEIAKLDLANETNAIECFTAERLAQVGAASVDDSGINSSASSSNAATATTSVPATSKSTYTPPPPPGYDGSYPWPPPPPPGYNGSYPWPPPPPPQSTSESTTTGTKSGDGTWKTAGITVGSVLTAAIIIAAVLLAVQRSRRKHHHQRGRRRHDGYSCSSDSLDNDSTVDDWARGHTATTTGPNMTTRHFDSTTTPTHSHSHSKSSSSSSRAMGTSTSTSQSRVLWELQADESLVTVRVPYEMVQRGRHVSRGGYGEVYEGLYRSQVVAIKTLLPERQKDVRQIEKFLVEIKLMASLEHERIVRFIGVAWDSLNELCVVTEFMPGGDLRSLLFDFELEGNHERGFDAEKIKIALHTTHALTYLHSLQPVVLHRDLKSRNILLDQEHNAKLTDFGVSRERADATMTANVGSYLWMAPEVMIGGHYDEKADVFSLGVVLSELDTHQVPYSTALEADTDRRVPDAVLLQMIAQGTIHVDWSDENNDMAKLGRQCVAMQPEDRPSAAQVLHRINQIWRSCSQTL